ncbi:MAG: hypothetical protein ABIW76_06515 [Fibrobacteria bacterium]
MKALCFLLLLTPILATAGKSESDFRKAAPEIHRKALWLEENPDAPTWGDSLKVVLTWGRQVPYATMGTAKILEKELQSLPKDQVAGRVSSMMLVGYIQVATEPGFKQANEFEMAKAGLTCMIHFYENAQKSKPEYTIPSMERYANLFHSDALDEYIKAKLRK